MRFIVGFVCFALAAPMLPAAEPSKFRSLDTSFRHEIQRSIEKGNDFLRSKQDSNGWWSTPDHPSVTSLVLSALQGEPNTRLKNWQVT